MSETTFQESFRRRLNPQFGFDSLMSNPMSSRIMEMAIANNSNDSEADGLQFKQEMSSHRQLSTKKKYARTPPKCKLCLVRFKNYSRLETHLKKEHPNADKVYCEVCHKGFYTRIIMHKHHSAVHQKKTDKLVEKYKDMRIGIKDSQCHICGVPISKIHLKAHVDRIHLKKKKVCEYCGKEYSTIHGLKGHILDVHPEKSNVTKQQCHKCEKSFLRGSQLRSHLYTVHKETIHCDFCGEEFVTQLQIKKHMKNEHPAEWEEAEKNRMRGGDCPICQKFIRNKYDLQKHIRSHDAPSAKCDICNKVLASEQILKTHKSQVHENKDARPFSCEFCQKKLKNRHAVRYHLQRYHGVKFGSNDKPSKSGIDKKFNCSICSRSCSTNQSLKIHMLQHEDNINEKSSATAHNLPKPENNSNDESAAPEMLEKSSPNVDETKKEETDDMGVIYCGEKDDTFGTQEDQFSLKEEQKEEKYDPLTVVEVKYESQPESTVKNFHSVFDSLTEAAVKNEPLEDETYLITREQDESDVDDELHPNNSETVDIKDDMDDQLFPYACEAELVEDDNDYVGERSENDNYYTDTKAKDKFACQVCKKEDGDKECNNCGKGFLTAVHIDRHKIFLHPGGKRCQICSEEFSTEISLERHIRSLHPKEYSSMIKLKNRRQRSGTELYVKQVDEDEPRFSCDHCNKKFKTTRNMNNHIVNDHPNVPRISCEMCDKEFALQSCLNAHEHSVHSEWARHKYRCKKCDFKSKSCSVLERHVSTEHPESEKYHCGKCGKSWYLKGSLSNHHSTVHKRKVVNEDLQKEKPPVMCDICGQEFKRRAYLRSHIKVIHKKERPHKCEICEKTFTQKRFMQLHVDSVHLKLKKHQCSECGELFALKMYLKSHITFKHTAKAFTCQYCGKDFAAKQPMQRHIQRMHKKETLHSCRICGEDFNTEDSMLFHIQNSHGIKTESS